MTKQVPFTAHIRISPSRTDRKRFEYIRDLQKIATEVYAELKTDVDLSLAFPGGGQHQSITGIGGYSGQTNGTAVKPQIGDSPAQLMITGFLLVNSNNIPAHPDKQLIHSGNALSGYNGSHLWDSIPASSTDSYASLIKTKIESAISSTVYTGSVYRLEVAGTLYGNRGIHFPQ